MILTSDIEERRDEIITVAMGKCWHHGYDRCVYCGVPLDGVSPSYSFNTLAWFDLFNWLTKEKPEWWRKFFWWYYETVNKFTNEEITENLVDHLSDLFVQWLIETETGMWEECSHLRAWRIKRIKQTYCKKQCKTIPFPCDDSGKILTPLGRLIKQIKEAPESSSSEAR